jgi:DNA primase
MLASQPDARAVKSRCDFTALVRRYVPRLRPTGGQFIGRCPFHTERHPSFYAHPRGVWHCFGCGAGGDVFDFVMRAETCDFRRAVQIVARFSGVARESEPRSGERLRTRVGASPAAAKRPRQYSPSERARIIAQLEATEDRSRRIRATNDAASAALATACEPDRTANFSICAGLSTTRQ